MQAIRIHEYGGIEVLKYEEAPIPETRSHDVLIKVHAAGVNPIDWKIRQGYLKDGVPIQFPFTLGWDVAGVVEAIGGDVDLFETGDHVFARADIRRDGSYAEYVAINETLVADAPKTLPLKQAAAIPIAASTAWTALFDVAGLKSGQTILIHGASGGVGTFAIQLGIV